MEEEFMREECIKISMDEGSMHREQSGREKDAQIIEWTVVDIVWAGEGFIKISMNDGRRVYEEGCIKISMDEGRMHREQS